MASQVFFSDLRATDNQSLLDKIGKLADAVGLAECMKPKGLTAVKIHFGERGNTAFLRPLMVRPVVDAIRRAGAKPFITDAGTLYVGTRANAVDHITTALLNGFAYPVVDAPLIIADGLNGRDEVAVELNTRNTEVAYVASAVARADALVSLAHFKLHELAGFGGAIKNVGMGSGSRRGKMAQHSELAPIIDAARCVGCGTCYSQCAHDAITLAARPSEAPRPKPDADKLAVIDSERCVGCAGCIYACPEHAIGIDFSQDISLFMERMVDYTVAALKGKRKRSVFINFLTQISPACDCHPFADAPIVADIGILASRDPVAVDQASVDLMNDASPLASSKLGELPDAPADKVRAVYPFINWEHQLDYAEHMGLGTRSYELIRMDVPKEPQA